MNVHYETHKSCCRIFPVFVWYNFLAEFVHYTSYRFSSLHPERKKLHWHLELSFYQEMTLIISVNLLMWLLTQMEVSLFLMGKKNHLCYLGFIVILQNRRYHRRILTSRQRSQTSWLWSDSFHREIHVDTPSNKIMWWQLSPDIGPRIVRATLGTYRDKVVSIKQVHKNNYT